MAFDYTNLSLTGIFVFFTAFLIGVKFPDWDFKMKLRHRNILTHSPIILIIFQWIYITNPSQEFRYFILGSSLAIGIHLIFDIFPKGWTGGALLQMPIVKYSFNKRKTQMMLLTFILLCLGISVRNISTIEEMLFCVIFGTSIIIFNAKKEEKIIRPLMLYLFVLLGIGSFKYPQVSRVLVVGYEIAKGTLSRLL